MPTISRHVPRGDVLLHRGSDERIGVKWEQDRLDGAGYSPVNMKEWSAVLRMTSHGEEVLSVPCACTSDGLAIASVSGDATDGIAANVGEWRIDAYGPDGQRVLMGWGYFEIAG